MPCLVGFLRFTFVYNLEKSNYMKKMILLLLLSISFIGGAVAQQKSKLQQQSFIFKFVSGKDMFFVPYGGNDISLKQFIILIERNRELLESTKMYVSVASYATKGNEKQSAKEVAYIQRNRIKSELITRCGVTEDIFATDSYNSHAYDGLQNVVVVSIPASIEKVRKILGEEKAEVVEQHYQAIEEARIAKEQVQKAEKDKNLAKQKAQEQREQQRREQERIAEEKRLAEKKAEQERIAEEQRRAREEAKALPLTLRTNLLYFASGMINAGVEYKSEASYLGYLINGGYSPFGNTEWNKNLGGWFVAPEVRYYIGEKQAWFVGVQFLAGGYNVKLSDTGYQSTVIAGGITGGYKLTINKLLDMDFSLGLGYGSLNYDSYYKHENGTNVYKAKDVTKNTFMPIQLGVSLIFKL